MEQTTSRLNLSGIASPSTATPHRRRLGNAARVFLMKAILPKNLLMSHDSLAVAFASVCPLGDIAINAEMTFAALLSNCSRPERLSPPKTVRSIMESNAGRRAQMLAGSREGAAPGLPSQGSPDYRAPNTDATAGNARLILSSMISLAVSLLAAQPIHHQLQMHSPHLFEFVCVAVERAPRRSMTVLVAIARRPSRGSFNPFHNVRRRSARRLRWPVRVRRQSRRHTA